MTRSFLLRALGGVVLFAMLVPLSAAPPPKTLASPNTDPQYASLWLYEGTWHARKTTAAPDAPPKVIENACGRVGKYFACQQTVDGKVGALIIFIPAEERGHFFTQAVLPEGFATGRGELTIEGEHWTYSSKGEQDGKVTFYRTTNVFSDNDRIHFEQSKSADGDHWSVTDSGDEVRVRPAK